MDPNATLKLMRESIRLAARADKDGRDDLRLDHLANAGAYAADLDEWLSKDGFPPDAWLKG